MKYTPIDDVPDSGPETALRSAHVPASSQVYEQLRAQIVTLALKPGTRLSRQDLAKAFGVSQSPVREAIQRLERVGLVVTYRQSRTEVTLIDQALLRQQHFLRCGIECEVVHRLSGLTDQSVLLKASGILRMQKVLADDLAQIELFRELDEDFHRELFLAAGQEALHELVVERSSQMARLRAIDMPRVEKLQSIVEGHAAVMDAIVRGDAHCATDAMRAHLSGTISRLPEIIKQAPQYFK